MSEHRVHRVAVLGSTGFIGAAVRTHLEAAGVDVLAVRAPRLSTDLTDVDALVSAARSSAHVAEISAQLDGVDAVVNAAGIAAASAPPSPALLGANALLPRVLHEACVAAGIARMVHISSAAVQGRRAVLDESWAQEPFSAYSTSKALGELTLRDAAEVTILRPTSVQGQDREVTRLLARIARRAPLLPRGADSPSPQVLVENVAAAVVALVTWPGQPPALVLQPSEGLSTADVLRLLGGREPVRVPRLLTMLVMSATKASNPGWHRRLEMLWQGQAQEPGWLDAAGWRPPHDHERWRELGTTIRTGAA